MRLLVTFIVCMCLICLVSSSAMAPYGTLNIKVTGNQNIQGAFVTIAGLTKITNSVGVASFTLLMRQTYIVNISAPGYVSWSSSVWFQKNQTVTIALQVIIPRAIKITSTIPVSK